MPKKKGYKKLKSINVDVFPYNQEAKDKKNLKEDEKQDIDLQKAIKETKEAEEKERLKKLKRKPAAKSKMQDYTEEAYKIAKKLRPKSEAKPKVKRRGEK